MVSIRLTIIQCFQEYMIVNSTSNAIIVPFLEKEHLDLLLCLFSSTVDQSDPFSATRLLSSIAPSVLPGLRKRAAASKLNLVQVSLNLP